MNAEQALRDFIVQLVAEFLAFRFLRREKLVGQMPQVFLKLL